MDPIRSTSAALIAVYALLLCLAKFNPNQRWVYWLFGHRMGPRTDISYLTKRQLWGSSWRFLAWGGICLAALTALVTFRSLTGWGAGAPVFTVVLFLMLVLLCGMGLVGGIYLLIRFVLRPANGATDQR